MAIFKVAFSALIVFLLVGCTDTGGKLEGWVNDTLDRSTITSGDLSLTVNEGSVVGVLLLLDKPIKEDTTLSWTVNGPATKFAATTGTLSFSKGDQSKLLQITTLVDPANDGLQSFVLSVSGSALVFANELNIALNILDLSTPPTLTIADVSISEGNLGGTQVAEFTVTSSRPAETSITFSYSTSNGTAQGGSDFTNTVGIGTIPIAGTTATISVPIIGDTKFEIDEVFTVSLAGGSGYSSSGSVLTASGTILNDDNAPTLSISNVSRVEGNSGSANLNFTISVSAESGVDIELSYATSDGATLGSQANAGTDYTAVSGSTTIFAGNTTTTISVPILGDTLFEADEVFTMTLSGGSGYATAGSTLEAIGTITNDDQKIHLWNFASGLLDPLNFTFDSRFIDFTSGNAPMLKKVGSHSITELANGTHDGTVISGSYLTLDGTAANESSLIDILPSKAANLVLYYRMDNNFNNSSNYSSGGVTPNFNGTLVSGNAIFTTGAKVGSHAGDFDGTTRVSVPNSNSLTWTSFTRMAWINIREPVTEEMRILSQQGTAYWILSVRPDLTLTARDSISGAYGIPAAASAPKLTPGRWHHVAIVRDIANSQYRFYVDGVLRTTVSVTHSVSLAPGNPVFLGAYSAGSAYFRGLLDELAAFDVPLTDSDMSEIYDAQKSRYSGTYTSPLVDMGVSAPWSSLVPVTAMPALKPLSTVSETVMDYPELPPSLMSNVLSVWHFDETTGTSFADSTTTGLTATASGSPVLGEEAKFRTGVRLVRASSSCLTTSNVDLGNQFSFSGWANVTTSTTTAHTLFANTAQAAASNGFKFFINTWNTGDAAISFQTGDGSAGVTAKTDAGAGAPGNWQHYVVTVNKTTGTASIYVNGQLANSSSQTVGTAFNTSAALKIGCMTNSTGYLNGAIDEFAIWTRELTQQEVLSIYLRGANRIRYQVRSCASDPCNEGTEPWVGPGQNSTTYFSELYNYSSVVNGSVGGSVRSSPLNLSFSNFTSTPPFLPNKRYFQYRVFMESDDDKNLCEVTGVPQPCTPKLKSVLIGPQDRYYAGNPTLINNTAITISSALAEMTKSDVTNACTQYQVSTDNGVTWKYYDGSAWVATTGGVVQSNPLSAVEGHLQELGPGSFKFKAFFSTNSGGDLTQSCQLNSVQIKYDGP